MAHLLERRAPQAMLLADDYSDECALRTVSLIDDRHARLGRVAHTFELSGQRAHDLESNLFRASRAGRVSSRIGR